MLDQVIGGRYKVIAKLGEGGMGAVYEARHTETSRRVAVKVISGDSSRSPSSLARFETEAKSAGQLESQYIAQVLDAGRDETLAMPFLVMEYLTGEDLSHLFERLAPLDPDLTLRLISQACLGLEKAHAAGIIHRDIKPANLLLAEREGSERVLKILDFGIAKLTLDGAKGPTRTGALIGSPMYMSPEQARGAGAVDHRSDIWSLGVVMYQALAGRTPFHDIEGIGELLMTICTDEPPSVREVAPWVDEEIAQIVSSALKIDAAQRFQSAAEMSKAIRTRLPMGISIDAAMLQAADQSQRPTATGSALHDSPRDPTRHDVSAVSTRGAAAGSGASAASTALSGVQQPPQVARLLDGPTMQSVQPVSVPVQIPTLASETGSSRALAPMQAPPAAYPTPATYAPPAAYAPHAGYPPPGAYPPSAGPAGVSQNWYGPQSGPQAPPPQWGHPPPAPAPAPKSRAMLWFGCGVSACFLAFVGLIFALLLIDEVVVDETTESSPPTEKPPALRKAE